MKCSLLVLSSHLDGELEVRRQGELEAHLVGCQRCRSGLGYLREEVERVSALGRVRVADHSMEALLVQLGLAEAPEDSVDMTGTPMPGGSYWAPEHSVVLPDDPATPEIPALDDPALPDAATTPEIPAARVPLPEWAPDLAAADHTTPPDLAEAAAPELIPPELLFPSIPHAVPPAPPATAAPPPTPVRQWPPPSIDPDPAPFAPPSAGAFPPGGPEPSEPPTHATASGGDAEMTASPPWTPHREAPPEPTYPLTDEDVLDEPIPVERFGPPQQARPSLFERLRDRVAVRRALSRSTAEYDDSVQIVSGTGAPLRSGRARTEVERRRLDAMQPAAAAMVGAEPSAAAELSDPGDEVDLGPLPKTAPFVSPGGAHMPRPMQPGQLAIPGTDDHPARQVMGTPMPTRAETQPPDRDEPPHPELPTAPPPRPDWPTPMRPNSPVPPPRHTLESAIGAPPPIAPRPSAPDPLAEALSEYERGRAASAEPRPWRPREIPEDMPQAEPVPSRGERAAPVIDRPRHSPSQLREGRRLLAIFGAATLVMLIVGVVSGRTTTPLPSSNASSPSTQPSHAANPAPSQPAARASAPAPQASAAAPQASARPAQNPAPAGVPQLTGVKVLGDTGSGYQVNDFRYGQHPNDFRIVLDMGPAGSATGTPKATVGFLDSTTLLVSIEGVVPAGSTGSLPPGSVATGVSLLQPSPFPNAVTYQIKLARAVTFSAGYVPGPLRLVLDLAG